MVPPGFRPARSFPVTSGRFFNGAAELPLGAERRVRAGVRANHVFNGAIYVDWQMV
jgi:hypothetical protein